MPDFHGPLPERRAAACAAPTSRPASGTRRPLSVYFFGGSTMFGLYQRDEHTIPSEFARLAQRDGIRRAGRQLRAAGLRQLAGDAAARSSSSRRGDAPDLAVFYDGFNEVLGQFQLGPHSRAQRTSRRSRWTKRLGLGPARPAARRGGEVVAAAPPTTPGRTSAWCTGWAAAGPLVTGRRNRGAARELDLARATRPSRPSGAGRYAASIYARGVDLDRRLAGGYGFETAFFWQPFLYSKRIVPGRGGAARLARHRRGRLARGRPRARARASTPRRRPERRARRRARAGHVRLRPHQRAGRARGRPARSTSSCGPSCCACRRDSGRERPRDQRLLPRLGGRARAGRPARGRRPGGALHAHEARRRLPGQRDPLLPARRAASGPDGARRGRLLRQAAHHLRAAAADLPARRARGLRARSTQADAALAAQEALDPATRSSAGCASSATRMPGRCSSPSTTRATRPARSSRRRSSRRRCSPSTASASGRPAASASARATASTLERQLLLPALARAALLGVHLLLRLPGQLRRVQADGPRALRRAALRRPHPRRADRPARGRLVPHEHALLRLPERR